MIYIIKSKEIYVDISFKEVTINEFKRCDSAVKKYQCNSSGYCYIFSCCNVGIDENCKSPNFYKYY